MREKTIVLNTLEGQNGEVLERTKEYVLKKDNNGLMTGDFVNISQEEMAVKLTLTGLSPMAKFCFREEGKALFWYSANGAGILELKQILSAGAKLKITEEA